MNNDLRKASKKDFEKDFFKLINNAGCGKTMESLRKHRDIRLVTTEARRNLLVSERNHHTKKHFSENVLAMEMRKTQILLLLLLLTNISTG